MIEINDYDNFMFDLYGTLIDLHTDEWAAHTWNRWVKWLKSKNIKHPRMTTLRNEFFRLDKEFRNDALEDGVYGYPEIDVCEIYKFMFDKYGNNLSDNEINEAAWAFRKFSTEYIRLYPNVENYLKMLHEAGKKVVILSNAQASYTRPEILMFGLDKMVDDYFLSSDYDCMKPDVAYYNTAIEKCGFEKYRTIMIGDNEECDVKGAINAGIGAFLIKDGNLFVE